MEEELTQSQIAAYREVFNLVDTDKSGTIDAQELGVIMRKLG